MTPVPASTVLTDVLAYLQTNQYRRSSFDRLISNIPSVSTPDQLSDIVRNNPNIFTSITTVGGLPGLRIRDSWDGTIPTPRPVPEESLAEGDPSFAPTNVPPTAPVKPDYVAKLIQRAGDANSPHDAVQFSQAALNAANAVATMRYAHNIPQHVTNVPVAPTAE